MKLALPQVTLCAVDDRTPALAVWSLRRSMRQVDFARVVLFTEPARLPRDIPLSGIDVVAIDPIGSVERYSEFMLHGLQPHVRTPFLLVSQWDGFVLNAGAWDAVNLAYDYVGAPWGHFAPGRDVGNGGFSLRSRRLLDALLDPRLRVTHPEDTCICHLNRELLENEYGIRIAPLDVARRFAFEDVAVSGSTFGVHGLHNFGRVLTTPELNEMIARLPESVVRGRIARELLYKLLADGRRTNAAALLRRRFHAGVRERENWKFVRRLLRGLLR